MVRGRDGARQALASAVLVTLLLTACTSPVDDQVPVVPAPASTDSPGEVAPESEEISVAVVLPARNSRPFGEIQRQREAVDEVGRRASDAGTIGSLRTVVPDRFSTMGDVVELLAQEGHDLVCALGPGAARAIREVAARFPETRFCAAPGKLPTLIPNALIFDMRIEESAYLAGIAARFAAGDASGGSSGTPALIVGDTALGARLAPAFSAGFLPVGTTGAAPLLVATDERSGAAAATAQVAAGAFLIFAAAGRAELGIVETARESGTLVIGTSAYLAPLLAVEGAAAADEELEPGTGVAPASELAPAPDATWNLLLLGEDLSAAVRDAIDELSGGWNGGSRSLGYGNGALTLTPGTSPVWERIRTQVLATLQAIIDGDIIVPVS